MRTLPRGGRLRWETHGRKGGTADNSKRTAATGRLMVEVRISCAFPTEVKGADFASFYRPFPGIHPIRFSLETDGFSSVVKDDVVVLRG